MDATDGKEADFFPLFQVNHDNMEEIMFALCWHFKGLDTDAIDKWPFYRYETWVIKLKDVLEEQKDQQNKQSSQAQENMPNTGSMMSQASSMTRGMGKTPKAPSVPSPKLPSGYKF